MQTLKDPGNLVVYVAVGMVLLLVLLVLDRC